MEHSRLRKLIFWALCCDIGYAAKKLVAPGANLITDALHIPGGIATSFSLMFLVLGAALLPGRGCAAMMGLVQSGIAFATGHVGSMGALAPIGYVVPGIAIDIVMTLSRRIHLNHVDACVVSNAAAGLAACLTANCIVFRLSGLPLLLYASLATCTGAICGVFAGGLVPRVGRAIHVPYQT